MLEMEDCRGLVSVDIEEINWMFDVDAKRTFLNTVLLLAMVSIGVFLCGCDACNTIVEVVLHWCTLSGASAFYGIATSVSTSMQS